jgi:hypothetical protein
VKRTAELAGGEGTEAGGKFGAGQAAFAAEAAAKIVRAAPVTLLSIPCKVHNKAMKSLCDIRRLGARPSVSENAEPHPVQVLPFGRYGAGALTGHPIGLVIVVGILLMGLIGVPEARAFFAASAILGGVCGLLLWLVHR